VILALFPELSTAGGVQRSGRLTAAVIASFAKGLGHAHLFLSLNDPVNSPALRVGSQEIAFTGFARSKARFVTAALENAIRQPLLIVALHPNLATIIAPAKILAPRARAVTFAHGMEVWSPLGSLRRWSLARNDLLLAPSAHTVSQLISQQGISIGKARKLAWSLGPEFDPNAPPHRASERPDGFPSGRVILTAGRWDSSEGYKGVDHLIAAMPSLLGEIPDARLVAIGEGTDLPRLKRLAQDKGVSERVHFLPFMAPEHLACAYDHCEIFALPSAGEGFGLVFIEAMAHGKPVIGGAHGGTPEVVEDGVTGYLVRHGDVTQLTEHLRLLLKDEALRQLMGSQALARVRRDFTFPRFAAEFTSLLEGLVRPDRSRNLQ